MKKIVAATFLGILLLVIICLKIYAVGLGTLSYWYSDDSKIGRWSLTYIKVYTYKLNTNSSFVFSQGISHGCVEWENALGIDLSTGSSSSYSNAPIKYHGGTMSEIQAYGRFFFPSSYNGIAEITSSSTEGTWTYGSSSKTGKHISAVEGCIVDKNHSSNEYKETCTHEMGHALGWYGHSSSSSDIMYEYGSSITSLTTNEKNHLSQVY